MKRPKELDRRALESIVDSVQQALYLDYRPGDGLFWNPDVEWDSVEALDQIAATLHENGLIPQNPEPFRPN
jgi:hypothetical protein